ncbi:unnamed protein product [Linum trigynum]|uniref:Uncharacterized protein n=1 Tax=Linum trigynum TaxID=586398 RepID=A0AAV2GX93_9ROSI
MDVIIVEEYPPAESVICSLQNPKKMAFRRPKNYENVIRKLIGPNRCLMDLSSAENMINRLHYRWRIASA